MECRRVRGYIEFDVLFNEDGYFCYSISHDGIHWTFPIPVEPGHQQIRIGSDQGTCYVRLMGERALMDNLRVVLKKMEVQEPSHFFFP